MRRGGRREEEEGRREDLRFIASAGTSLIVPYILLLFSFYILSLFLFSTTISN